MPSIDGVRQGSSSACSFMLYGHDLNPTAEDLIFRFQTIEHSVQLTYDWLCLIFGDDQLDLDFPIVHAEYP
ncbi:MAG: hypothetical protein WCB58_01380 [Acidobacteriaceae bacterium]